MEKIILEKTLLKKQSMVLKTDDKNISLKCLDNRRYIADDYNMAEHEIFTLKNNIIKCSIVDAYGEVVASGKARCHPDDNFDYSIGIKLSSIRARMKILKLEEKHLLK